MMSWWLGYYVTMLHNRLGIQQEGRNSLKYWACWKKEKVYKEEMNGRQEKGVEAS